jgi:hypothetical protein
MPGIFDLIQGAMGRPDPTMQLRAALNPLAGVPASGAPAGPGGGPGASGPSPAPAAPGAPPGDPGGVQQQQQQAPQPQATQTPPDLGSMFVQLMQRQQANEGFNRGLGMLAAGFAQPRDRATMIDAMSGQSGGDPASLIGNVMKLQQYNQQQTRYADLVNNSDSYAKAFGMDPAMFKAAITAAGPQGAGDILGKIAEGQMGITGTQTDKEYKQAIRNFQAANPNKPLPPELQTEAGFAAKQSGDVQASDAKAKDLVADQHNFTPALSNYDKAIGLIDQFNSPAMQEGAKEFLGTVGSVRPVATMSPQGKAAYALYKQIMATQFSAGVADFKGAGRITQQELTQDAPSQSTMGQLNQDPSDFFAGVQKYRDQLAQHRGNLFGAAQKSDDPRLSDEDYAKYVAPNLDVTGGPRRARDFSTMSDDDATAAVGKLSRGQKFIGPDGQVHTKN